MYNTEVSHCELMNKLELQLIFLIGDNVPVNQVEADQDELFGMFATGWSPFAVL